MAEIIDNQENAIVRQRPALLTVLCVLTFVASAYYLFSGFMGLFVSEAFDQSEWNQITEQVGEALGDADENSAVIMEKVMAAVSVTVNNAIAHAFTLSLIEILVALMSAFGAYWMWNLKRNGFWIYTGAKVIGMAIPLILLGFNMVTGAIYGIALFVGLIFIILYSTTRKHMS